MPYTFPAGSLAINGFFTEDPDPTDDAFRVYAPDGSLIQEIRTRTDIGATWQLYRQQAARTEPAVLPSGHVYMPEDFEDVDHHYGAIYDLHLDVVLRDIDIKAFLTGVFPGLAGGDQTASCANGVDRFYVAWQDATSEYLCTLSPTGVFGPTAWHFPSTQILQMAVSRDETILYHYGTPSSLDSQIHRYDLVNNIALSDLVGPVQASCRVTGLRVLADDTILVAYCFSTAGHTTDFAEIRRYATDGSTLNTYTVPASVTAAQGRYIALTAGFDDPASFWAFLGGIDTIRQVQVSDGTVLHEWTVTYPTVDFLRAVGLWMTQSGVVAPTTPPPTLVNSVPCCGSKPGQVSAGPVGKTNGPSWTPSCVGGAAVPSAPDLQLSEYWDY